MDAASSSLRIVAESRRRTALAAAYVVSHICALALLTSACEEPPPPVAPKTIVGVAQVIEVTGAVQIERAGVSRPAAANDPLIVADELITGPGSAAVVRYADGTEIHASANTRFKVTERPGGLGLELGEGTVVSRANEDANPTLFIQSKSGGAQIVKGSELRFELSGETSSMDVLFGTINVINPKGEAVTIVAGETMDFALGQKKTKGSGRIVNGETVVLTMSPLRGAPLIKARGQARFAKLNRSDEPIAEGTDFELPSGAQARLSSAALKLLLASGSKGRVGKSLRDGAREQHSVTLDSGAASIALAAGNNTVEVLRGGADPILLSSRGAASAELKRKGRDSTVIVRSGTLTLEAFGKSQELKANEVATLSGGKVTVKTRGPPSFVLPHGRRSRVYVDQLEEVGLALGGAGTRRFEVASDEKFNAIVLAGETGEDFVAVTPPVQGELFWRVVGEDAASSAVFEPDRGRSVLKTVSPKAEVAETGQKATVVFQSAPPALTLSFAQRPGAASYMVRVYRAGDLKRPLIQKKVTQPQMVIKSGNLREGEYLWSAAALGPRGNELSGGRMNKLELSYDNSNTILSIARPRPNEVKRLPLRTDGIAPEGSKLSVNGQDVALDRKGRFSAELPDSDTLVYRLTLPNGTEAYWLRTLRNTP